MQFSVQIGTSSPSLVSHRNVHMVLYTSFTALAENPDLSGLLFYTILIINFQLRSPWWLNCLVIKTKLHHVVHKAFNIELPPASLALCLVLHPSTY